MLVYRDTESFADPRPLIRSCVARLAAVRIDREEATALLIEAGEVEAGIADALFPRADGRSPLGDRLRLALVALGHLLRAHRRQEPTAPAAATAREHLSAVLRMELPPRVRLKVPEGFAHYALYPEAYLDAAAAFRRDIRPDHAVCLGLRSIGTSLSAVVAAELEAGGIQVESATLRPRGHPFDRRPELAPDLGAWLTARREAWFLIVDEGPGLSGSSITGVAATVAGLGIPDDRIVLFPSWLPDGGQFVSEMARRRWPRHAKFAAPFESIRPGAGLEDLSGGAWRRYFYGNEDEYPPAQPRHERRKYLRVLGNEATLLKFAGLGRYGRDAQARALRLSDAGFVPPPLGLEQGFLATRFVAGAPLRPGQADGPLVAQAARYIGHLARTESTGGMADPDPLIEMAWVNVTEGLGPEWADRLGSLDRYRRAIGDAPAVALDARMMPHEWLQTDGGYLKADALDHHADHFFPGPHDPAWDVAGFAVEFDLSPAQADAFAQAVMVQCGDHRLAARLPFHRVAYLAFRLGYATMAADALAGSADGARWRGQTARLRGSLRTAIGAAEAPVP